MKQTIGKRLRELRGYLRQKEVAAALEIGLNTYKNYEYGICEPPASILLKIKEVYQLGSVDEILQASPACTSK